MTDELKKAGLPGHRWVATHRGRAATRDGRCYVVLRRPPLRRRQAVPVRHRGLRPDVEVDHRQPAGVRLDPRAARGHRRTRTCCTAAPSSASGRRSTAARRGRSSTTTCRRWRSTSSPSRRRRARSWPRRTAAACGCWTCASLRQMTAGGAEGAGDAVRPGRPAVRWQLETGREIAVLAGRPEVLRTNPPRGDDRLPADEAGEGRDAEGAGRDRQDGAGVPRRRRRTPGSTGCSGT